MAEFRNLIGGEWSAGGEQVANVNPSDTDDIVGHYARGDAGQVLQAIEAAREAAPGWRALGIQKRSDILDAVGTRILARKDELGQLLSREEGKTLAEGIGEAARAGQIFKFFAGEALRIRGDLLDSVRPGLSVEITREPVGVVGIITPWNFPIAIPAWKIAPALAYGNTVVFKPAELAPGCAWEIVSMLVEAGLPAGVLNLVMGRGSQVGQAIVDSPDVNAISFTGSQDVGMDIARTCAALGKKVQLEMGGKNPLVVLDDADMEKALGAAINGAYFSTGQRCTASSRLIVTAGIHDRFVAALTERMTALRVGHALASDTQIGPVVSQSQLDQNLDYLEIGRKEGASLSGGDVLNRDTPGHFMAPALFTEASNAMRICQEEIFGPVAAVIRAADYDEALAIANDTPFGLSAGICTGSLKYASDFKRNSQAGMVMVNLPTAGVDYHVPFGGTKGSSYGSREQGSYAKEFYTVVKTSYTDAG